MKCITNILFGATKTLLVKRGCIQVFSLRELWRIVRKPIVS